MRYEVGLGAVPPDYREMIIDADDEQTAILRAGILVGKAIRRRRIPGMQATAIRFRYARPTGKPLKNQHVVRS